MGLECDWSNHEGERIRLMTVIVCMKRRRVSIKYSMQEKDRM